ncbi:MAG: hypothetical protein IJ206_08730 [Oscillospiraceae bacterium]|nr:hypothetical protein [Oscillospiraceae bacterium]
MNEYDLISLECPDCGGTMEVSASETSAKCPYCGHTVLIKEKQAKPRHEAAQEGISAAKTVAKINYRVVATVAVIAFVVLCFLLSETGRQMLFPKTADPFAGLEVQFSGTSGEGYLTLQNRNSGELADVDFRGAPEEDLSNGDVIVVTAEKIPGWRWKPESKEYTVSGLTQAVTAVSELSEQDLETIYQYSKTLIDRSWEEVSEAGKTVTWETTPYAVFLLEGEGSWPGNRNLLLDCYQTVVTREDGSQITFWQAVRYPNVMRKGDGTMSAEFSSADLEAWRLGYYFGFAPSSAVYGWETAEEMETEISSDQDYRLTDRMTR